MSFNAENLFTLFSFPSPEPLNKTIINATNVLNVWSLTSVIKNIAVKRDPESEEEPIKL